MIIFKNIRWKNFLSTGNYWNEIQLDVNELTIFTGKNGAGKSTILDALSFVLYGKPFRETKKKADIVNSITRKNCLVEILFTINNDTYKIVRGMNPAKFEIFKNEALIPQNAKVADYQSFLEIEILRCNHKAFCQVVVLGSASYKPFMDLTGPERRAVVENILDLEIFTAMRKVLSEEVKETDKKISILEADRTLIEDRIAIAKKDIQIRLEAAGKDLESYTKPIESADAREVEIVDELLQIGPLEDNFTSGIEKLSEKRIGLNQSLWALQTQEASISKEINFYNENDSCPTCRQKIADEFKTKTLEEATDKRNVTIKEMVSLREKIEKIDERIKNGRELLGEYKAKLRRKDDLVKEMLTVQDNRSILQNLLNKKKESTEAIDTSYLENLEYNMKEISTELDALYIEQADQKSLSRMLKDDGVKAQVIGDNIGQINELINKYLITMEFLCQFTMDGNFEEIIKSRYRDTFGFGSFSEGEKLRITLSILFAWRDIARKRNSIDTNIIFFDEILDSSLDAEGVDAFIDIIKKLTIGTNCFIISHNDNSIQKIENCVEFVKLNGLSRIVSNDK